MTPFASGRLLASDRPRQPNPECPVCGVFYTTLEVDLDRATLNDVIDTFVKETLGFGDKEFVLSNEVGILYDADETDNLPKKLTELGTCQGSNKCKDSLANNTRAGIGNGNFLTIMDEDDEDTFVNVVVSVQKGYVLISLASCNRVAMPTNHPFRAFEEGDPAVRSKIQGKPSIPRKPKKAANGASTDTNGEQNGKHTADGESEAGPQGVKRSRPDEDGPPLKKAKTVESKTDDDVVVVEDAGGAIVID